MKWLKCCVDVSRSAATPSSAQVSVASSFKGLALFTPGGDCVYCLDSGKRDHWHLDLCAALQSQLGLAEPPYFLLPCFTATVDRWVDAASQQVMTVAEAYPRALRFQGLLNSLFGTEGLEWQPNYTHHEECSVWVIESYRTAFPQLWESHDLILRVDAAWAQPSAPTTGLAARPTDALMDAPTEMTDPSPEPAYHFKLFVSGAETNATEAMLRVLCNTLELSLPRAYTLELIDVLTHPDQAEAAHITATPTLVQVSPVPTRRIVGCLPSPQQIRALLGTP